jgi:acyl carrier protein
VNSIDDLLDVVRDQLGLPVTAEDADRILDEIPGWDSVHLLWLMATVETRTGRTVSMLDVLEAATLAEIYEVASR